MGIFLNRFPAFPLYLAGGRSGTPVLLRFIRAIPVLHMRSTGRG